MQKRTAGETEGHVIGILETQTAKIASGLFSDGRCRGDRCFGDCESQR
jgi:hypothetical protein